METDKDRYEQIIKKIELAEVYAHEVKSLLTKVDRTCEIGTIERTDREDTLQQRVHLLLKECEDRKARIEQLEEIVLGINGTQDRNKQLLETNSALQQSFDHVAQLFESQIIQQEYNNLKVLHFISSFLNDLSTMFTTYERIMLNSEGCCRKLILVNKTQKDRNTQLQQQLDSVSRQLKVRDKEVEDLHFEKQSTVRKYEEQLQKTKLVCEDRILRLSSEVERSSSVSVEMYKKKIMQQKMDYEKEISDLKNQLASRSTVESTKNRGTRRK